MSNYYCKEAYELSKWAGDENNRIKASHLVRAANRLEQRYRKNHKGYDYMTMPYGSRPPRTKGALSCR